MALHEYVKFQRGTPDEYKLLKQYSKIENNTLYFIYAPGATQGSLYLGNVLIGNIGSETSTSSLSALNDVLLTNVSATDLLMADSNGVWKNISLTEVANLIAAEDQLGFEVNTDVFILQTPPNSLLPKLELQGFANAVLGSTPIKGAAGKLEWSEVSIDDLKSQVNELTNDFATLEQTVAEQIASANHLSYQVIESLSQINQENVVYLLPDENKAENNAYNEYMLIKGSVEQLGSWEVNLDNYVTQNELQGISNQLNDLANNLNTNYVSNDKIVTILNNFETTSIANTYATKEQLNTVVSQLGDNYVTVNKFNSTIGDITNLPSYSEENKTSIVDELNNIYEYLTWHSIIIE